MMQPAAPMCFLWQAMAQALAASTQAAQASGDACARDSAGLMP